MTTESDSLASFSREIDRQEDLLYGIALFFEGLSLLHAGQEAILETHRKQFRNIIQAGSADIERARELLAEAQRDPHQRPQLAAFHFRMGEGYTDSAGLLDRAERLVAAYRATFPDRPRDRSLTPAETLELLRAASAPPVA